MTVPAPIAREVGEALEERGLGSRIVKATAVGGGCINHGTRVETDRGVTLFLKWNASAPHGMFAAEVDGLTALRSVGGVAAPEPVAVGSTWLLLEHVETGAGRPATSARLGAMLAALHAAAAAGTFGWERDNWIGSLPQDNTPSASWGLFWRDRRVAPQLERARGLGHLKQPPRARLFDDLLDVIPGALPDVDRPGLLHGDLWGGNWLTDAGGEPWLIDPAVHRGDGEVDLAMSELFGGFDRAFYRAYHEARGHVGAPAAYGEYRRDLYQLYYLLVHVNLFGASYEAGARRAAEKVVAALR
ncbi:MAG: fructosamine kinase family protein [Gemmatimonadales bacterium]